MTTRYQTSNNRASPIVYENRDGIFRTLIVEKAILRRCLESTKKEWDEI